MPKPTTTKVIIKKIMIIKVIMVKQPKIKNDYGK
jgi:hypothetical protein